MLFMLFQIDVAYYIFKKIFEGCIFAPVKFTDLRLKIWIIVKIKNKEHDSDMK